MASPVSGNTPYARFSYHFGSAAVVLATGIFLAVVGPATLDKTILATIVVGGTLATFAFTLLKVRSEDEKHEGVHSDARYKMILAIQLIAGLTLGGVCYSSIPHFATFFAVAGLQMVVTLIPRKLVEDPHAEL